MWTFGVTYLVVGQLNTITGFLFVVLFGMGVDYGIHAAEFVDDVLLAVHAYTHLACNRP